MTRACLRLLTAWMLLCVTAVSLADSRSFAIRAGRVMPVSTGLPWVIEDGVIVVRDGVIEAIGAADEIEIPRDLELIEAPDAVVTPGLINASTGYAGQHSDDRSIAAGHLAVDAFNQYGDHRGTIAHGVTTIHLSPGWHRLVPGHGSVVRLGGPVEDRVLERQSDLTIALGERVFNPPALVDELVPPSPDQAIKPATRQRPTSRLDQFLALREAIESANADGQEPADWHAASLQKSWRSAMPLRVQAQDAEDLRGALHFLHSNDRAGYLVGGLQAGRIASELSDAGVPLVYTVDQRFDRPAPDLGADPTRDDSDLDDLSKLNGVRLALATTTDRPLTDLRLAAATAQRGGLTEQHAFEAITLRPAEILGVSDRVGSLEPGKDADLVMFTGMPLDTRSHVRRVYVAGELAYEAPGSDAVLVRADQIWIGPNDWMAPGEVLIEDGRITAVGRRVSAPPTARVIHGGPGSFVTPGMIDAHGHLLLQGDRGSVGPEMSLAQLVGAPEITDHRVARAGVTTVVAAPYRFNSNGSRMTAVKTHGQHREDRIVRETTAIAFDVSGSDPSTIPDKFKGRIQAGEKYLEQWKKYEKELEEWKKAKAEGTLDEIEKPKTEEVVEEKPKEDPITGTWAVTVSGGPLPEPAEAKIAFRLEGTAIEGRVVEPAEAQEVEHKIVGTLDGNRVSGTVEVDTQGMGTPYWEGEITEPDRMTGNAGIEGLIQVNFSANRVDKSAVEFKVARRTRRTTGKDGRPLPPKVNESLEPVRAWLEKKIPAVVAVGSAREADEVIRYLVEEKELPVVLLNAPGVERHAERLAKHSIGVIVPPTVMQTQRGEPYHQAQTLNHRQSPIAFQSDAEDGARSLPLVALYSVERGLSPEAAIAALTIDAARMYKIDDRLGSLEPGKDGDLVIFSGYPFDANSVVRRVIVNGQEVSP
ncbi:MAG: amidohydrolase family protein [Phycisphaerales bacterium]